MSYNTRETSEIRVSRKIDQTALTETLLICETHSNLPMLPTLILLHLSGSGNNYTALMLLSFIYYLLTLYFTDLVVFLFFSVSFYTTDPCGEKVKI